MEALVFPHAISKVSIYSLKRKGYLLVLEECLDSLSLLVFDTILSQVLCKSKIHLLLPITQEDGKGFPIDPEGDQFGGGNDKTRLRELERTINFRWISEKIRIQNTCSPYRARPLLNFLKRVRMTFHGNKLTSCNSQNNETN